MPHDRKCNVVVVLTDQQRWDTMGLYGNPLDITPNLDRLALDNTLVRHCSTCQPVCGPARASFQTGKYATRTGCFRNGIPLDRTRHRSLADYFNDAGYTTGYIGKWHLATEEPVTEPNRGGYRYWFAANHGSEKYLGLDSDAYCCHLFDGDNRLHQLPGYRTDGYFDLGIRFIDEHRDSPFFLMVSLLEPHQKNRFDSYEAPRGYAERYDGRWVPPDLAAANHGNTHAKLGGYWGMCKRIDEGFGRLLDTLESFGLDDNTIVLFTSDHGCHFKTRASEYKRTAHESSIRVPCVLAGPEFRGGGAIQKNVSLVDLPPTLLDACGIAPDDDMDGRSILPLVGGGDDGRPDLAYVEFCDRHVGRAIRTTRWKYSVINRDSRSRNDARSDHYVEEYLYDLKHDPHEQANLAGRPGVTVIAENLRKILLDQIERVERKRPTIDPAPEQPPEQYEYQIEDID